MVKAGWRTTEFWLLVVFSVLNVAGVLTGLITNPAIATAAATVLGVAYTIARAIAKVNGVAVPEGTPVGVEKKSVE